MGAITAYADPAIVIKSEGFANSFLWLDPDPVPVTVDCINVDPANEIFNASCHGVIPEGHEPAALFQTEGFSCGTPAGSTTNTKLVATSSGQLMFTCKFKKEKKVK